MPDKIIVTIEQKLIAKYGASKMGDVRKILDKLASYQPGIKGQVVYMDNAGSMQNLGLPAMDSRFPLKNCKDTIDRIFKKTRPHYLVIFGSGDVVPFQLLSNRIPDREPQIPSDLPYACDAPFSPTGDIGQYLKNDTRRRTNTRYTGRR